MLISLEQAMRQLRLFTGDYPGDDAIEGAEDVLEKAEQASAIILDYLKHPAVSDEWDAETTPKVVQAATLLVLSDLYEHRGGSAGADVFISSAVVRLLRRSRDPAMA